MSKRPDPGPALPPADATQEETQPLPAREAELQSAASALQAAGAAIPAAVVLGRFLSPDFNQAAADLWDRAHARPFSFDRCCICDEPWN